VPKPPCKEVDVAIQAQERRRTHHHEEAPRDVEEAQASSAATSVGLKNDLDDILDEIDEILEENAEEFVKGYVQKGGE
jgi:ubiquitin-like protein Pup